MSPNRTAMTILELLVVVLIIGIVYTFGLFALNKTSVSTSNITLNTLKTSLGASSGGKTITLVCDTDCTTCTTILRDSSNTTSVRLAQKDSLSVHTFDPNGELQKANPVIYSRNGVLKEGCFSYTLNADGTSSHLLLKSGPNYYLYTQNATPIITQSIETLRNALYLQANYPMTNDDYYAAQ
jgi:hypothetical protein